MCRCTYLAGNFNPAYYAKEYTAGIAEKLYTPHVHVLYIVSLQCLRCSGGSTSGIYQELVCFSKKLGINEVWML
jgi:hypothetical protein